MTRPASASYAVGIEERLFHFCQPAGTSRGVYTTRRSWLLRLTDDSGRAGLGECAPLPHLSCDDLPDYGRLLRQACDHFCQTGELDHERLRPYPSMRFGLETALQHLLAGTPRLFDTPFGRGQEGIPINGLIWMGTFEEMGRRIEEKLAAGFRCVKLKIGAIDFDRELQLLERIRQRFPASQVELRVDANGAFSPEEAPQKLRLLARHGLHSIEQPIRQGQWQQMARLCRLSPLPIALDEELIGVERRAEKERLLDTIRPAYLVLKPSLHGGMAGTREWIALAAERGIGTWMTSALESNVGLNAIAHLAAHVYGPHIALPQGLGTGQLFTDNIDMPLQLQGDRMWFGAAQPTPPPSQPPT